MGNSLPWRSTFRLLTAVFVAVGAFLVPSEPSRALEPAPETGRADFLFRLQTAMKTKDYPGLANCFEFEGTEGTTQKMVWKVLDQFVSWPSATIKITERSKTGEFIMNRDGRKYTLNGEWSYQVHIEREGPVPRTYVFPAGKTKSGKHAILLSVPVKGEGSGD